MSVSTWSTDPNLNINQLGLSLADGVTRIRDLNDQFRVLMSQIKLKFDTVDLAVAGLQDSDLTAIAALTTTNFGRNFLTLTDANAALTYVQAQPLDADLTAIAALTTTAFGRGMLTQAGTAGALAYLGAQAALGYTPLNAALSLSDVASAVAARTNLGLGTAATYNIGTSGGNVPLLNGSNVWSGANRFSQRVTTSGADLSWGISLLNADLTEVGGLWKDNATQIRLVTANFAASLEMINTGSIRLAASTIVFAGLARPDTDNATALGSASNRFSSIFATSSRIEAADAAPLSTGTLTAACAGTIITLSAGITVPAGVFSARNFALVVNNTGAAQTITQGAGLTLRSGALTGNRTIATGTIALIIWISAGEAIVSGPGIS